MTLHQRQLQSTVAIGMVSYNEGLWQTAPAPSPEEIIWRNVQVRSCPACSCCARVSRTCA